MGGVLEGINQDKRKYDTSLNSREGPLSLEDSWKPASVSIVMSDNPGSECNNNIVEYTYEFNGGSLKPSPTSVMQG